MQWKPDKSGIEPIYKQIARFYEEQIMCGELAPGALLPTERELAGALQVNRSTVTAAYEELRATGLITSAQGSGTWVTHHHWGIAPRNIPNWQRYTNGGTFLPALPLVKQVREAAMDRSIINLAKAELAPSLMPTSILERLLREETSLVSLNYLHQKGDPDLREAISLHLKKHFSISVTPEEIMVTSGAQQALHIITQCLLKPGDAIAMECPSYAYSLPLFVSAGLRLHRLPVDQEGLNPDEIVALHKKHRIRMVFTNPTYHNPTGTTLSVSRRKELLRICEELRIPIVEDDAFGTITLDNGEVPPAPLKALDQKNGSVIYIGSLSKTVSPGLRIGWIAGPKTVIERLSDAKQQMDYGTSSIAQRLLLSYLANGHWEKQTLQIRGHLTRKRDITLRALSRHLSDKASWNQPEGSYHIWCQLHDSLPDDLLLSQGIAEGVLFTPGSVFGAESGYLRLTYSWADEQLIEEGICRLRRAIE